jgi:TonB-linked SusC/RagA family outer membrane protein
MKKILQSFLCALLLIGSQAYAQSRNVTGVVTGSDNGQALPGVSIKVTGSNSGTQTDGSGKYSINVSNGSSLTFTYIGYETKTVNVGAQATLNVALVPNENMLNEVVVSSGFGIRQAKKDVTGSTSTISGKEIENLPVQSVDRAFQGRIAGVQVAATSGIPGSAIDVRIRGVSSFGTGAAALSPLYVIDNVQVNSGDLTRATTSSNALAALNPNDIESITVLKDAAASAIYGAQAANGVVVITTKRGKNGATQVNANYYTGYNDNIKDAKLLTGPEYIQLSLEAYANRYGATSTQYTSFYNTYVTPFGSIANVPTYDWFNAITQKGKGSNYEVNIRGGGEKTQFYMSGNYNKQEGQVFGTTFDRGSFKINLDHQPTKKWEINTSINLSTVGQRTTSGGGAFANISRIGELQAPINPIYNPDGSYNTVLPGAYDTYNVLQLVESNKNTTSTKQLTGNVAVKYYILPSLFLRSSFGLDYYNGDENNYLDPRFGDGRATNGDVTTLNTQYINFQNDEVLNYTKTFNNVHNVSALVGFNYRSNTNINLLAESQNFPLYIFTQLSSGATPISTTGGRTYFRTLGYFGKLDYNYKSKYYISGTARYDGSSKFGANSRFGWFPAGAVSYRISQEPFFKNVTFVSDLKIRASYGITGSQGNIGNFDAQSLYSKSGDYVTNGSLSSGVVNTLGNADLQWEQSKTTDIAVEFSLFKNRITGSAGVYRKLTTSALTPVNLPLTSGFTSVNQNTGKIRNQGYEVQLSSINLDLGGFRWTTDANISYNQNRITEIPTATLGANGEYLLGGDFTYTLNRPINQFYTYRSAGVNPADGRAMWYDGNGNITYTLVASRDRVYVGDRNPRYTGGFGNTFSYKGVTLNGFFQFNYGNTVLNSDRPFFERSGSTVDRNQTTDNLRRWTTPGQITDIPKPYFGGTILNIGGITHNSQYATSDRFYEDGSYIRLKSVVLSYDLPKSLLSKAKLRSVRVYLQGTNLLTITKYRGIDPETLLTGDFGQYPQYKNLSAGINVGF